VNYKTKLISELERPL